MSKTRNFLFVINNPTEEDGTLLKDFGSNVNIYICWCLEQGETGTPHYQGYVHYNKGSKKILPKQYFPRAHVERCTGTPQENIDYIFRTGKHVDKGGLVDGPWEHGVRPLGNGKKRCLVEAVTRIKEGVSVKKMRMEDPVLYHMYGRTLDKIEDDIKVEKHRTWMTAGYWFHGPTGVGKSHKVFEGFTENPQDFYIHNIEDKGWWDGYAGQKYVIINDFRGQIPYDVLLQLCDKWPYTVSRRGRCPIPFLAEEIRITSPLKPSQVYKNRDEADSLAQLLRRFSVVDMSPERLAPIFC